MIHENRLQTALDSVRGYESLRAAMQEALGTAWDSELECYRLGLSNIDIANGHRVQA